RISTSSALIITNLIYHKKFYYSTTIFRERRKNSTKRQAQSKHRASLCTIPQRQTEGVKLPQLLSRPITHGTTSGELIAQAVPVPVGPQLYAKN
ncbi:MAG: hypothetical protein Q4F75_05855, partial [Pseudomonadota bacterium]|nr:hypothetical protein [Pseudomonadota bacterium]